MFLLGFCLFLLIQINVAVNDIIYPDGDYNCTKRNRINNQEIANCTRNRPLINN